MSPAQSPFEAVLGDRFGQLHPTLQEYFSAIPAGGAGIGDGVFDTVGTPRRWLHPVLRLFVPKDVLFGVWERDVPFTVINTPVIDGELHLTSTRLAVKVGTNHLRVPGPVAPRVKLTERYSAEDGRQHVSVSVRVPILGTVYEYAGSFRYDRKAVAPCG